MIACNDDFWTENILDIVYRKTGLKDGSYRYLMHKYILCLKAKNWFGNILRKIAVFYPSPPWKCFLGISMMNGSWWVGNGCLGFWDRVVMLRMVGTLPRRSQHSRHSLSGRRWHLSPFLFYQSTKIYWGGGGITLLGVWFHGILLKIQHSRHEFRALNKFFFRNKLYI